MATKKEGGKNRKYGRNARRPSNANQDLRSAKNKRTRIERQAERQVKIAKRKAAKKIVRGATRAIRRAGMTRQDKVVQL